MKYILYISILFAFTSCKVVEYVPVESEVHIVDRYVDVEVPADSSSIYALLECDSLNRVYVKQLKEKSSANATHDFKLTDNQLSILFKSDPPPVKAVVRDSTVYVNIPYPIPGPTVEVYKQTWWQTTLMWIGIIALLLLLLIIIINRYGR